MDLFSMIYALKQCKNKNYDLYPTEDITNSIVLSTNIGADRVPMQNFTVLGYTDNTDDHITIRRLGKNLFNPSKKAFTTNTFIDGSGHLMASTTYAISKGFLPVLPSTNYVFSGNVASSNSYNYVVFYDMAKDFISRFRPDAYNTPAMFETPSNCYYIQYLVPTKYVNDYDNGTKQAQLELGTESTDFSAYSERDYTVRFDHDISYSSANLTDGLLYTVEGKQAKIPSMKIDTLLGINYFYVVNTSDNDVSAISATFRVDPTLAYDKIRDDIVALGE